MVFESSLFKIEEME